MSWRRTTRSTQCPLCGAPLELGRSRVECPYCGTVIEPGRLEEPVEIQTEPSAWPATPYRPRVRVNLMLVLGGLILAAGALVFYLVMPAGEGQQLVVRMSRTVQYAAIPVPTDRPGPSDVLVSTYDSKSEQRYLSYIGGADPTWRWDSPPLSDLYREGVVIGQGRVFLSDGARLLALDVDSGDLAWQADLSDSIISICQGCLRLVGNAVVVLSQDGVLQAFEAESGRQTWSQRLNETPRNLWVIRDRVAVLDKEDPEKWNSVTLQIYDVDTGDVVQSIPGRCESDRGVEVLPIYNPEVIVGPDGEAVYFLYGLLPGCAQRWDPHDGEMIWQTTAQEHYFDRFNAPPFLSGDTLYGSYGGKVIALDTSAGRLRLLVDEQDYELTAYGEQDGLLVVLARRTRGSERYELWGLDAAGGRKKWHYIPQGEEPLESSSTGDNVFSWHLTENGLVVLHLLAEGPTLLLETLDLQTGTSSDYTAASLENDYWGALVWDGNVGWLSSRKLYAVDLSSGEVLYSWP